MTIKYEVNHQLMSNLKAMMQTLIISKQSIFTCRELISINNGLIECKPIVPKPPKVEKKIIEGKCKEVKNEKK